MLLPCLWLLAFLHVPRSWVGGGNLHGDVLSRSPRWSGQVLQETDLRHVFAFYGEIVSLEHIDEAAGVVLQGLSLSFQGEIEYFSLGLT